MSIGDTPCEIVKLMTITRSEFEKSLAAFDPDASLDAHGQVSITGAVIRFEALPPRRPGGLLSLPQARVTIVVQALGPAERAAFLRRFDVAFQRGGG